MFVKHITKVANDLQIGITIDNANQFWNHMECVEFINTVSMINLTSSLNVATGLTSVRKYISESKNWYGFLIKLHDKLSEYEVQKKKDQINKCQWINLIPDNEETNVNDIDIEQQLDGIVDMDYSTIENIQLNPFKLRALKMILHRTLNQSIDISRPSDDKLVVKGYNVKLSDIYRSDILHEFYKNGLSLMRFIEIFAINNLFIDADVYRKGEKLQMSLIAPTWHVIGHRHIDLSGHDGEPHTEAKAADGLNGRWSKQNGENGLPGAPGGPAGHFMGIGKKFFDAEKLQINISGGIGGPGQNGGNGSYMFLKLPEKLCKIY